ncbi:hypothetical protein ACFLT0_01845, partial [Chloroflexota bacterium]
ITGLGLSEPLRKYLDQHPEYTSVFYDVAGGNSRRALKEHGDKFKGFWPFNNWEEFVSRTWVFPDEVWKEIENKVLEAMGEASAVRITDPEGTYLEWPLTAEEARRWQMTAFISGHLLMHPLHSTSGERQVASSLEVPPVLPDLNGVLAGTANHCGFFPRIEVYFEHGRMVDVKGGGRYGDGIRDMMEKYQNVHWPVYPDKGYFWFCDCALCTAVKAFRRTSDMFSSYWVYPNFAERTRAGVLHMGFGSRRHGEDFRRYVEEHDLPTGHIHVHNYFATFEVKLQGTHYWQKIIDKGWLTAMDEPDIRALATKYGVPDELLRYDWIPPLPGINCEGNYAEDYAPNPIAFLKKRIEHNQPI